MLRSRGIFVTASLLAFGCETVHHPVATVDAAGAGGSVGSSTSGRGGTETAASSGVTSTGGNAMTTRIEQSGGAGSGSVAPQGGASPGGSPAAAGRSTQAGAGGTAASTGGAAQAGGGTSGPEYLACGCGCCGGTNPQVACYYPDLGESLANIIAADVAAKSSANCAMAGCSMGVRSVCCTETAPDPSDKSVYSATNSVGALDHLRIEKETASGTCIALRLTRPAVSTWKPFRFSVPSDWGIQSGSIRDCNSSAETDDLAGGLGTITFQGSASNCTLSIHATLFLTGDSGSIQAQRFDADNVTIVGGVVAPECP